MMKKIFLLVFAIVCAYTSMAQNNVYGKKVVGLDSLVSDTIRARTQAAPYIEGFGTGIAGSNTEIQYNDNGVFGSSSGLIWDEGNTRIQTEGLFLQKNQSGSTQLLIDNDTDGTGNSAGIVISGSTNNLTINSYTPSHSTFGDENRIITNTKDIVFSVDNNATDLMTLNSSGSVSIDNLSFQDSLIVVDGVTSMSFDAENNVDIPNGILKVGSVGYSSDGSVDTEIQGGGGTLMFNTNNGQLRGNAYYDGIDNRAITSDKASYLITNPNGIVMAHSTNSPAADAVLTMGNQLIFKNDGSDNWEIESDRAVHIGHKSTTGSLANNAWATVQSSVQDGVYLVTAVPANLTTAPTNTRNLSWLYIYNSGTLFESTITDSGINWRVSSGNLQIQNTSGSSIDIAYNLIRLY